MILPVTQFAAESSSSGISSLGVNLKSFIFQLVTFLIVLLILKRWVFPKLVATLEERRKTLEQSLEQARLTEETLKKAEAKAESILQEARAHADAALAEARSRADELIAKGETDASERGARIIKDAEEHLAQEREKLRAELREELAGLVVDATQKVLSQKIKDSEDRALIERSLKGIG